MSKPLRVVFAGTPDFAVASLRALLKGPFEVCWVYTQPDSVSGRGQKRRPSAIKRFAQSEGVVCFQPDKLGADEALRLSQEAIDVLVVVAYGKIIPPSILEAVKVACINVHGSLLPRWRGAAPIQRAILAGDRELGVCVMQMDKGLDLSLIHI